MRLAHMGLENGVSAKANDQKRHNHCRLTIVTMKLKQIKAWNMRLFIKSWLFFFLSVLEHEPSEAVKRAAADVFFFGMATGIFDKCTSFEEIFFQFFP